MPSQPSNKSTNVRIQIIALGLRAAAFVSPSLAARLLERLFLATRRFEVPQRESRWLEQLERRSFVSRGRELEAWTAGEGSTIVLAHGWEGRGSQMGAFVQPLIQAGFRVVTFDAPGHGQSPARASSLIEMADAIRDVVDVFGPCHAIIAHSAGAAAAAVALSRGTPIERAVFVAPPTDLGGFLHKITRRLGLSNEIASLTQRRLEEKFEVDWRTLRIESFAPVMKMPLLVIHDDADREVRYENAIRLVELWPNARLMTTHGLGHRRVLSDGGVIARAVEFVGDSASPRVGVQASRAAASPAAV